MLIDLSARSALAEAQKSGLLVAAKPVVPWAGRPRLFLMCRPLFEAINKGKMSNESKAVRRWAALEAAIGHFVEGGYITQHILKQLDPPKFEHWTFRNKRPRPSLRVFGRFAMPDVFVGTHVEERQNLGGKWSSEYEHNKLVCEDHWKKAGMKEPFSDNPNFDYAAYITDNASLFVKVAP